MKEEKRKEATCEAGEVPAAGTQEVLKCFCISHVWLQIDFQLQLSNRKKMQGKSVTGFFLTLTLMF